MLKPNETVSVYVNQAEREGYVLAVLEDKALIEYEMPKGTTALRIVSIDDVDAYPYKTPSYLTLSAKWIIAMYEQGTLENMIGNPQGGGERWLRKRGFNTRIEKVLERLPQ